MKKPLRFLCVSLAAVFFPLAFANAQKTFTGNTSNDWNIGTNWNPTGTPTNGDAAMISSSDATITSGTSAEAASVTVSASGGNRLLILGTATSSLSTGVLTLGGSTSGLTSFLRLDSTGVVNASGIVMSPDIGNSTIRLNGAGTLTIGGGTGSISKGGGTGTSTLEVNANVGALGVSSVDVSSVLIGVSNRVGSLTINSGQTYAASTQINLGNGNTGETGSGTLNLSGGTVTTPNFFFNAAVLGAANTSVLNFNGGTLNVITVARVGGSSSSQTFNWNDGTIANITTGSATLQGNASENLRISLSGTGVHSFDASVGRSITIQSTAVLQDKSAEAGTIRKTGQGTLNIQSVSTYTGPTEVSAGTLLLSGAGTINSSSSVSVANGATFTNNSTTGFSKELMLSEGAVLSGSGVTGAEFAPTAMTITADLADGFTTFALAATDLTKSGNLEFALSGVSDGTYVIFSGSAISGAFSGVSIGGQMLADQGGGVFSANVDGVDYVFTDSLNTLAVTIPEPSTWMLLTLGLLVATILRHRRRKEW